MKRAYLEEDLDLIQKYFPGARTVRLRTPFDLTQRTQKLPRLAPGSPGNGWTRDILWTN